jgi:hypothetical protein
MDAVTIVIPLRRTHWLWLAAGLIPLTVLVYIGPAFARFFEQSRTPDPVSWIFLGFLTLFFGVLPMGTMLNGFLRSRRGATVVVLSRRGVRISERVRGGRARLRRWTRQRFSTWTTAPAAA